MFKSSINIAFHPICASINNTYKKFRKNGMITISYILIKMYGYFNYHYLLNQNGNYSGVFTFYYESSLLTCSIFKSIQKCNSLLTYRQPQFYRPFGTNTTKVQSFEISNILQDKTFLIFLWQQFRVAFNSRMHSNLLYVLNVESSIKWIYLI